MPFTKQQIKSMSADTLNAFVSALESLAESIAGADDCELALIEIEQRIEDTIHHLDAELRARPRLHLVTTS